MELNGFGILKHPDKNTSRFLRNGARFQIKCTSGKGSDQMLNPDTDLEFRFQPEHEEYFIQTLKIKPKARQLSDLNVGISKHSYNRQNECVGSLHEDVGSLQMQKAFEQDETCDDDTRFSYFPRDAAK